MDIHLAVGIIDKGNTRKYGTTGVGARLSPRGAVHRTAG